MGFFLFFCIDGSFGVCVIQNIPSIVCSEYKLQMNTASAYSGIVLSFARDEQRIEVKRNTTAKAIPRLWFCLTLFDKADVLFSVDTFNFTCANV